MTLSGIQPATFRLLAQYIKYCVHVVWFKNSGSEMLSWVSGFEGTWYFHLQKQAVRRIDVLTLEDEGNRLS